jgi:hypothetical protein
VTEVDPDPYEPADAQVPETGDPTDGGKHGEIDSAPSIRSDEPDDSGPGYPVGGGAVGEEQDAPPVAEPRPGA